MKKIIFLLLTIIFLSLGKPALAVQFKTGADLNFPKDQKIDDTVFVSGSNITFQSPVTGDILCAGSNIIIESDVKGDILCVGQNIKVTGNIDGNVRVMGQAIDIQGVVSRNVYVAGQSLTFGSKSNVKGDILFGVQSVDFSGIGGRDMIGAGQTVKISGSLLRNAVVTVNSLSLSEKGKIAGSLDYFVDPKDTSTQALIGEKMVKGEVRKHEIIVPEKPKTQIKESAKKVEPIFNVFKTIFGILSFTLLSFVIIYFSPKKTNRIINMIEEKPVITGLVGLATLIVTPIALMIICSTIIGLPVAFVLLLVYITTLFLSSLYGTNWVGRKILLSVKTKYSSPYLSAFVGCLAIGLLGAIPVVGWFLMVMLFLMGLGASTLSYLPEK